MTIRASTLAAFAFSLGLFAFGSAHAGSGIGAVRDAFAPVEKIVAKAGFFDDSPCHARHRYYERKRCYYRRWRSRRRHVWRPYPRRPHFYGHNYEIYTYRRPYAIDPRLDVQMVYGWYRGYYHPYPYYPGVK